MNKPELVVLAAGMGSRYGGLKQIDKVDEYGHIIIDYSIYDAIRAGFKTVTFIIKHEIEKDFREIMDKHLADKDIEVKYVFQEIDKLPEGFSVPEGRRKPWGTGHAIACCYGVVNAPFAVINADDYYGYTAFKKIYDFLENVQDTDKYHYAMVGYRVKNTVTEQGVVTRGVCEADASGMLTDIVETSGIGTDGGKIYVEEADGKRYLDAETLVSMNFWGFTPSYIKECVDRFPSFLEENLKVNPEKCEFFVPTLVGDLVKEGKADVKVIDNDDKWYGVTYKEDKPSVMQAFKNLTENGTYPKGF